MTARRMLIVGALAAWLAGCQPAAVQRIVLECPAPPQRNAMIYTAAADELEACGERCAHLAEVLRDYIALVAELEACRDD